jgi:hypothetical protein
MSGEAGMNRRGFFGGLIAAVMAPFVRAKETEPLWRPVWGADLNRFYLDYTPSDVACLGWSYVQEPTKRKDGRWIATFTARFTRLNKHTGHEGVLRAFDKVLDEVRAKSAAKGRPTFLTLTIEEKEIHSLPDAVSVTCTYLVGLPEATA